MAPTNSHVKIKRYSPEDLPVWNEFVSSASNATFLFDRRYMDYHSSRFKDHSLLIFLRDKLAGIFVANEEGDTIYSHGGLTYGGLVVKNSPRLEDVLSFFYHILKYYSSSFTTIVYKCFPPVFMRLQTFEDVYALFLLKAELVGRNANCVFERSALVPYQQRRKKSVKNSSEADFLFLNEINPESFWNSVLVPNLHSRFGANPVHSVDEMNLLMRSFPNEIHLHEIHSDKLLAGALVYEFPNAVHTQYLSAAPEGKESGALDVLLDHLIMDVYGNKEFVSLGTSNVDNGSILNVGLMNWKEGFGARTRVQDIYKIKIHNYELIAAYA